MSLNRISRLPLNAATVVRSLDVDASSNAASAVTLPAVTGGRNYIYRVQWSYDGIPTGGKLTIAEGATILWEQAITAAGPGGQDPDVLGTVGTATVITLAAGGSGVTGRLAGVRSLTVDSGHPVVI